MSAEPLPPPWRAAKDLCLFAGAGALLLAGVYQWTAPQIAEQQQQRQQQALLEVAPSALAEIRATTIVIPGQALGYQEPVQAFQLLDNDASVAAIVLPVRAPNGYNGNIDMLLGVDRSGRVSGVRVTDHRETPGLADGIERRRGDWIEQFDGRSLGDPPFEQWAVHRDGGAYDQLTGATVTPRAITQALARALRWVEQSRDMLFQAENASSEDTP